MKRFLDWLDAFLAELMPTMHYDLPEVDPVTPPIILSPKPSPVPETMQQMVLRVCKEEGLSLKMSSDVYKTIHCESNFNPKCIHPNVVNGKVSTTDYGICQINDYWHIGPGKDFPSVDFVMNNPEACVRFMCKMAKAGKLNLWVCFQKGLFLHY